MCDILLLEDDSLFRSSMLDTLAHEGLAVLEAESVVAAQGILQQEEGCRLLIADHDLGDERDLDGFAFAVRAMRLLPALRVIYVTGRGELLAERALTPRERALPKPFLPSNLVALAQEMLRV